MSTLELLQLQNEHKDNNFYEKGEDATGTERRTKMKHYIFNQEKGNQKIKQIL